MKTEVKQQVLDFMEEIETSEMSSNTFIKEFLYYNESPDIYPLWKDPDSFLFLFMTWPSSSSITRSRRYIAKAYWIGKRNNADKQEEYINEFALQNKF